MSTLIHKIFKKHIKDETELKKALSELDKIVAFESAQLQKSRCLIESMTAEIDDYKKQLEENQEKMIKQSKLSTIGEVTATLSHEFNNQMMLLQGNTDVLKELTAKYENAQFLHKILKKNENTLFEMAKLIKDIKKFSHQSSDLKLSLVKDSPAKLVNEAVNVCKALLKKHSIRIHAENQIPDVLTSYLPSSDLGQVFLNLIKNALDFIETDAVPENEKWVSISSYIETIENKDCIVINFSNYGEIPEHVMAKMFSPFFTTKEVGKGTGIGLSLSRKIVESIGGKINCVNVSKIVTFRVEIPVIYQNDELKKAS